MRAHPVSPAGLTALALALAACSGGGSAGQAAPPACGGVTCAGFGACVQEAGAARCACEDGYAADGLLCVPTTGTPTTNQVIQYGVAWTFDRQVEYGRFANGDYWVLGPVTVTRLTPSFDGAHHGWEVNPADVILQGFDSRVADFDPTRVPRLPYAASPGQSIVKAVSLAPLGEECRPCLQTAAVLTVLGAAPPDRGASVFRPPYFGADKALRSVGDLDPGLALPSLAPTPGAPTLAEAADLVRRVQLDHKAGWTGANLHPTENMPEYGAGVGLRSAELALRLVLDGAPAAKRELLLLYVQAGLDLYAMGLGGDEWSANGGHGQGRKLPIAFAALALADPAMRTFVADAPTSRFAEGSGAYVSAVADTVLYGQDENEEMYWGNLVFDTGSRTLKDPYGWIDGGHRPGDSYQSCCTAMTWKATATAVRLMPGLAEVWNDPVFMQYVDRWVGIGAWTQPDPCAPPDGTCAGGNHPGAACTTASEPTVCTGADAYCDTTVHWAAHYRVTYGPDGHGGCIADTDPSDGIGRFPLLHGASRDEGGWSSTFAEQMWDAHVAQ
jgi:hypothetical protein